MSSLGYDSQFLGSSLLQNENNRTTAVYRMLRKEKITDILNFGQLTSPRAQAIHTCSQTMGSKISSRSPLPVLSEKLRKNTCQPTDLEKPETSHKVLPMALQVSITHTRGRSAV